MVIRFEDNDTARPDVLSQVRRRGASWRETAATQISFAATQQSEYRLATLRVVIRESPRTTTFGYVYFRPYQLCRVRDIPPAIRAYAGLRARAGNEPRLRGLYSLNGRANDAKVFLTSNARI